MAENLRSHLEGKAVKGAVCPAALSHCVCVMGLSQSLGSTSSVVSTGSDRLTGFDSLLVASLNRGKPVLVFALPHSHFPT